MTVSHAVPFQGFEGQANQIEQSFRLLIFEYGLLCVFLHYFLYFLCIEGWHFLMFCVK